MTPDNVTPDNVMPDNRDDQNIPPEARGQDPHIDPADKEPAEGARPGGIPEEDRGQGPHIDPADKTEPAEGGREEASQ